MSAGMNKVELKETGSFPVGAAIIGGLVGSVAMAMWATMISALVGMSASR